ncbi:MAG: DEAD/DEAH box helicase, partial [Bacteroidota bacterium]|nr:DEAD/DEAH box helicase [Bacteroidota bacterium]
MDFNYLFNLYKGSLSHRTVQAQLQEPGNGVIHLTGMSGSQPALFAASLYDAHPERIIFVLPEREDAAYFLNDLENILGERTALFFPSSLKKPYAFPYIDSNNVLLRAEVLTHLSKNVKPLPVVTYAEALHEKVVTKKALVSNTVEARVGEALSIEFLMEFLGGNGFERADFVLEAGQYAIRGGIMDVFSFANELPYRVEFDGDKIDSIRVFDPATQLSEKNMNHITIIPNVQGKLVKEEHQSFLEFIGSDTILWCSNLQHSLELMQSGLKIMNESGASEYSADEDLLGILPGKPEGIFDDSEHIATLMSRFRRVETGTKMYFKPDLTQSFSSRPQPSFNKNFDLLAKTFIENEKMGMRNLIFADTAKQIERIYAIFQDIKMPERLPGQEITFTPMLLSIHEGFIDNDLKVACYTDHQIFDRYHRYRLRKNFSKNEALTLKELYSLKPGDFVTHIDHGIGKFAGLEKIDVNGKTQEAIRLVYKDNDILYVSIHSLHRIARFTGKDGTVPKLNKLGSPAWANLKQKTKKRVKDIAKDLIALYAKRRAQKGFAFAPDNYLQTELEASFIYEDTPDQIKSTADIKKDMEKPYPMDRLICGDVGFGKTEVAIRAAFKALNDNKQVAILVPTTILALQHHKTFSDRLKDFPCTVDYLNRFKSAAQQSVTVDKLKNGKIDIIIGTHRLLSKDI